MKIAHFFLFLFPILIVSTTFAQTGLYKCNYHEFKSETDPSKNQVTRETEILTLDFDAISNKYFMWRVKDEESGEDVFFKWNIKRKIDANYDKSKNIVQTVYLAKMELIGIETERESYIYKIDDLNNGSLNIIIYNPRPKTSFCFYNLVSF